MIPLWKCSVVLKEVVLNERAINVFTSPALMQVKILLKNKT